jgi:hypothetical protein
MHSKQTLGRSFKANAKGSELAGAHFSSHWLFWLVGQHCGGFAASECTGQGFTDLRIFINKNWHLKSKAVNVCRPEANNSAQ